MQFLVLESPINVQNIYDLVIKNNLIIIYELTEATNTKLKKMFSIECYIYKT